MSADVARALLRGTDFHVQRDPASITAGELALDVPAQRRLVIRLDARPKLLLAVRKGGV